ncbi:WD repeat protein 24 putative [Echinococcus multilocularis]|uniref:GATOR2 complex protein WDR24 n=1 Tax=Echinococcus multilocularis TaxID=6211 RepID=A0A068Y4I8_ECHMU|nr:WD repeat protein 24 putative [Echinococcus multilocularis]
MDGGEVTRSSREPSGQSNGEQRVGMAMEEEEGKIEIFQEAEVGEGGAEGGGGEIGDFLMMRRRGAVSKRTWVFDASDPLTCIAISNFYPLIAIAGRNLLQVLRVDGERFISVHRMTNLQRNISSTTTVNTLRSTSSSVVASTSSSSNTTTTTHFQPPRSYAINDVAWSDSKSVLATCSNAGDLIVWDLSRGITQSVCFMGHSRSVHRIHFNPNAPNEIISASHDGTVKLFDVRDQSCRLVFHVRTTAPSPARDVVYCPREGHTLAAAFENGLVCIWDTRNESRPARCFQAHNAVSASIDWHPMWNSSDRNWLATAGGRDNTIKVWDLNKTSPTTVYSLRTKNTGNIRWRVGETTQLISSCSLSLDLSIHLWELNRPYIPYITFEGHSHTISSISWSTEPNSFYSVGRDGLLVRHYVGDGLQTVREANAVALALNCCGPLAHALGGGPGQRVLGGRIMNRTSSVTTTRGQHVSLTQRVAPSNVVETTATTTATRTPHQLLVARRHLLPPNSVLLLDDREETVSLAGSETPENIIPADVFIAQGQSELFVVDFLLEKPTEQDAPLSSLLLPDTFIYLAKNYRISGSNIEEVCNHNAAVARHMNQDFLSHFWLTLKLFLGHSWQSSPPPTTTKVSVRTGTKLQRGDCKRDVCPCTAVPRTQQSSGRSAQAEGATSHSNGVCVLDFISRINTPEENVEREAFTVTTVLESGTPKDSSIIGVAASSSTISGSAAPLPPSGLPHHHHQPQQQPPSSVPDTGSLGRSVNFLFTGDNGVDSDGIFGGGGVELRHSDGVLSCTTPFFSFSSLPAEADAFFEETSVIMATSEMEQQQRQAADVRKISLPESNHKPEVKNATEESATWHGHRPHEFRDASTLDKRHPSARLDLTSATDCVEAVDPTVVANLTRPLDFTHLVGAWLLELIEAGHVQSVCTALLIFGTERTRINEWASEKQIETWFSAYLDVLVRFRLWTVATRIIKHCGGSQGVVPVSPTTLNGTAATAATTVPTPRAAESIQQHLVPKKCSSSVKPAFIALPLARHIAILNQTGTSVSVRCGKCSKPLQRSAASVTASTSAGGSAPSATPHTAWACGRHPSAETVLSTCAVCHMTVRGIYLWCIGCSHGGHLDHIREWITRRAECPAGCGHYCEYGKLDKNLYLQISA